MTTSSTTIESHPISQYMKFEGRDFFFAYEISETESPLGDNVETVLIHAVTEKDGKPYKMQSYAGYENRVLKKDEEIAVRDGFLEALKKEIETTF